MRRREPDIENLFKVFRRERPERATLFELFMNGIAYAQLAGREPDLSSDLAFLRFLVEAFAAGGYDYATTYASNLTFSHAEKQRKGTVSMNEGFVITDEASFDAYPWPDPEGFDDAKLEEIAKDLPGGMKLMIMGPGGVLENTTELVGYENMCVMLYDDPELIGAVFDKVGSILLKYYQRAVQHDSVGFICANDDWGFNTQTLIAPQDLRRYVFPWHKRIVQAAHDAGKPTILHSCGNMGAIIDDIVDMGFDAKHSYEDVILPVEDAYEAWHDRIAILGGMDVDFMVRRSEAEIDARCRAMLERTSQRGGYALGTGNSVPDYLPVEKYLVMINAALDWA